MQIPPASVSGVTGFNSAQSDLSKATIDVARPAPAQQSAELKSDTPDKTEALIKATEAANQAEASAKVIEAADETVGSIIDITV
ncbi:chemotaxis protein [Shewanella sp.]|uniref:chemotaxis protein n=1 Tax=Shewanella sp. TaxID=50422 RepID=UPI003563C788